MGLGGSEPGVVQVENAWTEEETSVISNLLRMADVLDRGYAVKSRIPIIGPLIAALRFNLTTHLREAYFDPLMERQVAFNQRAAEAVCAAWQRLKDLQAAPVVEKESPGLGQQLVVEARLATRRALLCNAELLAGPLPEYGECLGREFYKALYAAALASMAAADGAEKLANLDLYEHVYGMARRLEARWFWIARFYADSLHPDTVLREYRVCSPQRLVGPLIAWVHRTVTAHLREGYIDPVMERQVTFNRLVQSVLRAPDALNPAALEQLRAAAAAVPQAYRVHSALPLIGPLVAWVRRKLTAHLDTPYIVPAMERQAAFNQALVRVLSTTCERVTEWRGRERREFVPAFRQELARPGAQIARAHEFHTMMRQLIARMDTCVAGW
jgi:hypothetical protein